MIMILIAALAGAGLGHGARRALPSLIGLKDRSLPFATPWLELTTALFFAITASRLGLGTFAAEDVWPFVLVLGLAAIAACDYLVKLIPDRLSLPLALVGMLASGLEPRLLFDIPAQRWIVVSMAPQIQGHWLEGPCLSVLGAIVAFAAIESIRRVFGLLAGLEVMGLGDSKLAGALGTFLGPVGALLSLPLAFVLGVLHGLVFLRVSGQPHSPFGPPLAIAGWATLLFHGEIGGAIHAMQVLILGLPLPWLAGLYTALIGVAMWLIWRTRKKAAEYEALIEEDYLQVEEQLEE